MQKASGLYNEVMHLPRLLASFLLSLPGICLSQPAGGVLAVHYLDKPPYYFTQGSIAAGFLNERTRRILEQAGLKGEFFQTPAKRILSYLQNNRTPLCSPGWYRNPERETFVRFSLPIHQDPPHIILARPEAAPKIRALGSLQNLLNANGLLLLLADGYSYGSQLDARIAQMKVPPQRYTVRELQLAQMVKAGRGDYLFFDRITLQDPQTQREITQLGLISIDFPDLPPGEKRYLICSRQVPLATMEKINQAIRRLPETPR